MLERCVYECMAVYSEWIYHMSEEMGMSTYIKSICAKMRKKTPPVLLYVVVDIYGYILSVGINDVGRVPYCEFQGQSKGQKVIGLKNTPMQK